MTPLPVAASFDMLATIDVQRVSGRLVVFLVRISVIRLLGIPMTMAILEVLEDQDPLLAQALRVVQVETSLLHRQQQAVANSVAWML